MRKQITGTLILAAALMFAACSVNVKKGADGGDDKNVDIKTPFTDIHVEKQADARDTGLPPYPGARLKPKNGDNDNSANVNLSAFGFGLKVVVLKYESDDPPAKLISYYQSEMKKYGSVLQCHTTHHGDFGVNADHGKDSDQLKCEGDNSGNVVELKVGIESNQHIVAIEPEGKGSEFTLVYVHTHGKDDSI